MNPRSDFTYAIRKVHGKSFIMIEDLNKGRMSVTNDIENVVDYICEREKTEWENHIIIYKDSESEWCYYSYQVDYFKCIGSGSWLDAATKLLQDL